MTLSSEVVVWVRSSFQVFRCCLCAWLTQTLVVELALRYLCVYSVFFNLKNQVQLRDFFFFRALSNPETVALLLAPTNLGGTHLFLCCLVSTSHGQCTCQSSVELV